MIGRKPFFIFVAALSAAGPANAEEDCHLHAIFAVASHGGELTENVPGAARLAIMKAALTKARADLAAGAHAVDVVETIVRTYEDSGAFNAGKGAIADAAGIVETDAAIMDGDGLRAGAVASMTEIENPIHAARLVMDAGRHVLMVGDRGQRYVEQLGAAAVPRSYFIKTDKPKFITDTHGTVGAVALDRCGHIAAATSTGGYDAKIPGRVGDSPLVGDGVYASDAVAGFSATGYGEYFIRFNVSKDVADRMSYGHETMQRAMDDDLHKLLPPLKADGGMVGVDKDGNVQMQWNNVGMFRGYATDKDAPVVAEYAGPTSNKPR